MKFLHTLRQDLNKTVINAGFAGSVLMTCLLAFTATVYIDAGNDKSYNVIEAFFTFYKGFVLAHHEFASANVFSIGLSGYIYMFIPIIVAFPFMVSFCSERNNGLMRFTISRTGKLRYYLSKFFASFIGGGLAVLCGMILFGLMTRVMFPPLSAYEVSAELQAYAQSLSEAQIILKTLLSSFVYGAFSTLPAFFLSSFCKNPYIISCVPFMLIYVWQTVIRKLQSKAFERMMTGDLTARGYLDKLSSFSPDSPQHITDFLFGGVTDADRNTLIFNGIYLAVLLAGFILIMNLRTDKGN